MPTDLALTLVMVFAIFFLGSVVYFNDKQSSTNKLFFFISLFTVFWALANYFSLNPYGLGVIYFIRFVLFFAAPHAVLFTLFVYNFPNEQLVIKKKPFYISIFAMVLAMLLAISPYVFSGVSNANGRVIPNPGPLIPLFALIIVGSILTGFYFIIKKYNDANKDLKRRWLAILLGVSLSYFLLISTQFGLVTVLKNTSLILFAPLFMLPTFLGVAYATVRYKLLEAKALVVESLVFILLLLTLFELLTSQTTLQIILRVILFSSFFLIGIFLVKAVLREVSLREELQVANEGQENLIHIMNHQIKGYLGKARSIFAELQAEPEYCASEDAKPMLAEGLKSTSEGVDFIQQVLNSSNAQKGTITYNMKPFDFRKLVEVTTEEQKRLAEEKHLALELHIADGKYEVNGDELQLKEAVRNLIDNSLRYTQKGSVRVEVVPESGRITLKVVDTGVGIAPEDMAKLFTKGGKGKDSLKYNVNSTGYGLAFVKSVIEAHKGKVWAESAGTGKGSVFHMELPVA